MPKRAAWSIVQNAHKQKLIREDDVDSGNYRGLSTQKRQSALTVPRPRAETDEDAVASDLSSSDDERPQAKVRVPLSKDLALAAVQRSKVLKGLSIRGQVRVAALLQRASYLPGELLWSGQEDQQKRLVIIESGEAELWLPENDTERFVGTSGPGKVLGGLFAVGSASRQIFSVRVQGDMDSEDPQPLKVWEIASSDLEQFESIFNADDLNAFRRRVLQDVRMQLVPYLQQLLLSGVFSSYSTQFIARIVKDMDLRLFEPGQVIFKEKSLGRSLGVLVSGVVDIIVNGRKVMSKSSSGQEIGEAALFETNYRRHATTRCGSCESLMFLVSRDAFYMCLEKFPEEKIKLAEQDRHRIAMTVLKEPFNMCDPAFLHLVCTECEVVNLSWPKAACSPDSADEVMHLCYAGDLIVEVEGQDSRFAKKWEIFGLEAALGLRSGPPEYKLLAGRAGCTLVRVTWKAFEGALRFFPTQLWHLLRLASGSVPKDHPFVGQEGLIWEMVQPLLCQIFCTMDVDFAFCQALAPHFQASVYDAGCLIAAEGAVCDALVLLLSGEVLWSRHGIATFAAAAPQYFDETCFFFGGSHKASLTATTTTVIWRLHRDAVQAPETAALTDSVVELRQSIQSKLRSNLRNMKTWRRFNSEVLELLCDNIFLRTYLPNQTIFSDGDLGEFIFILMRGRAEVSSHGDDKVSYLEEGTTFGEMVLFGQPNRTTTVKAESLCIINVVHKDLVSYALRLAPKALASGSVKAEPSRVQGTEDRALRGYGHYDRFGRTTSGTERRGHEEEPMARTSASDRRHRGARKCLFDLSVPRLPPVQAQLYQAPETTQQALRSAFSGVMPRQVLLASSNMRGVRLSPPGSKKRLGLEDALPHIARVPLGRATYTEPLPPQRITKRLETPWMVQDHRFVIMGNLQVLASSLLRLSTKPSIADLLDASAVPPPKRPQAPKRRVSAYCRQLARSARAYAPESRPPAGPDVPPERDADSPAILDLCSSRGSVASRPDDRPLNFCIRRMVYCAVLGSSDCLVAVVLDTPSRGSSAHGSVLYLGLEVDLDCGSARTLSASPSTSTESLEPQDTPTSTRLNSIVANDVVAQALEDF